VAEFFNHFVEFIIWGKRTDFLRLNWTEVGAEYLDIIQGLIVSYRMQSINPNSYATLYISG